MRTTCIDFYFSSEPKLLSLVWCFFNFTVHVSHLETFSKCIFWSVSGVMTGLGKQFSVSDKLSVSANAAASQTIIWVGTPNVTIIFFPLQVTLQKSYLWRNCGYGNTIPEKFPFLYAFIELKLMYNKVAFLSVKFDEFQHMVYNHETVTTDMIMNISITQKFFMHLCNLSLISPLCIPHTH